ncbi:hypothetical protein ABIF21_005931 [Bradyrhizobium elkanii]
MDPDPALVRHRGCGAKLRVDPRLDQRAVPPRAHREQRVADGQIVAVAGDAELPDARDPARDLLALRVALVEVVIARAEDHPREIGEPRQVFRDDDDLGAEIDRRAEIERIAGEDHEIELRCRRQQPVELRQRVMQVGDDKTAHR